MSKKKWSKKKKITAFVGIFMACAIIVVTSYTLFKPDKGPEVTISTVELSNVVQTLDATGKVESGNQGSFSIIEGVKVLDVNVRVGDKFKKGDVLATFDAASLSSIVSEKQRAYDEAHAAYTEYLNTAKKSPDEVKAINAQVKALEAKIAKLKAAEGNAKPSSTSDATQDQKSELSKLLSKILGDSYSKSTIGSMIDRLLNAGNSVTQLTTALNSLLSGNASFDLSSMLTGSSSELSSAEMELIQLKAKQAMLSVQSSATLGSTYKTVSDSAYKSLRTVKDTVEKLTKGWTAENDGIVREIKISANETYVNRATSSSGLDITALLSAVTSGADVTSMISQLFDSDVSGMVVEYYPFVASFTLGKYDFNKVTMDQPVKVSNTAGKNFDGKITYISPVAEAESSINISSLLGTSGSSSGVMVKVAVPNPDSSIVIGFDVDISIEVARADNVPAIPIEALQTDADGFYVFTYNAQTKKVSKVAITTGLYNGSLYQILTGCKVGDVIINNPPSTLLEGDRVSVTAK